MAVVLCDIIILMILILKNSTQKNVVGMEATVFSITRFPIAQFLIHGNLVMVIVILVSTQKSAVGMEATAQETQVLQLHLSSSMATKRCPKPTGSKLKHMPSFRPAPPLSSLSYHPSRLCGSYIDPTNNSRYLSTACCSE